MSDELRGCIWVGLLTIVGMFFVIIFLGAKTLFWDTCNNYVYRVTVDKNIAFYQGFDGWEHTLLYRGIQGGRVWQEVNPKRIPQIVQEAFDEPLFDYPTDPVCDPNDVDWCFRIARIDNDFFVLQGSTSSPRNWELVNIQRKARRIRGCEASPQDIAFIKNPNAENAYDLLVADFQGGIIILNHENEWEYPAINPPFNLK